MPNTNIDHLLKWRNDTPGCNITNHLNNAGAALMPKPVIDAIHKHIDLEAEIGGYEAEEAVSDQIDNCYSSVAKLIGSAASNIAIVENATVATSQALSAFHYHQGDTIITTNVDYASNQIMLLSLASRFGVKIVRANDLTEGGADPDSVLKLIKKHRPKLVLMSWIPTNSGLIQDAKSVGKICREEGVPFVLDACQAVGQFPIDVAELNCDYLAATARKFLRGPRGIGFLYVSDRMLDQGHEPLFPDTHGATWTTPESYRLEPGAKRYENWEFSYALVLGLGAAAEYANSIDLEMAGKRAAELAVYSRENLKVAIPGVRVLDYGKEKCAIVSAAFDEKIRRSW
jgi:selenocysteine lyase/cysteine desulfurase